MKHDHPFFAWVNNLLAVLKLLAIVFTVLVFLWRWALYDILHWLVSLEEKTWIGNATVFDAVFAGVLLALNLIAFVVWRSMEINYRTIFSQLFGILICTVLAFIALILRAIEILPGFGFR